MNNKHQYTIDRCAILIIAAGESKRLGTPKQLLKIEEESMLNRLINMVQNTVQFPIYLVLGANADLIKAQLPKAELNLVENLHWQEGMGSSIRIGVQEIMKNSIMHDGILVLVCDQPYLSKASILSLIALQNATKAPITAAYYAQIAGTPALFHESVFPELLSLKGDTGAKKIIQERAAEVAKLQFENGVLDIDTKEDYQQLLKEVIYK